MVVTGTAESAPISQAASCVCVAETPVRVPAQLRRRWPPRGPPPTSTNTVEVQLPGGGSAIPPVASPR